MRKPTFTFKPINQNELKNIAQMFTLNKPQKEYAFKSVVAS